jgi:Ca2+-binding RTX toxin-like protein
MANFKASVAFDMRKLNFGKLLEGEHAFASNSTIRVDNTTTHQRDRFNGSFSQNGNSISGTANEWVRTNYTTSTLVFHFEGISLSASAVLAAAKTAKLGDDRYLISGMLSKADSIEGSLYGDVLLGYGGSDTIKGGAGFDYMDGGAGAHDRADFSSSFKSLEVTLNGATYVPVISPAAIEDRIRNIEDVATGFGNDKVTGDGFANLLIGNDGNDTLAGSGGHDRLRGGKGIDSLDGGAGNDTLSGGADADGLSGSSGSDLLSGEGGNDTLFGGQKGDTLLGGKGKDLLVGRAGRDSMTGGADADVFAFLAVTDSGVTATTRDFISDFVHNLDKIDLSAIDAITSVAGGNDAFIRDPKGNANTKPLEGHIGWYTVNAAGTANDRTFILINNDADTAVDMTIELKGVMKVGAVDFIL